MATHLFRVGSIVSLNSTDGRPFPKSFFRVEAQLPPLGTSLQYRIKSESEGFSRVVVEHQLTSLDAPPVTAPGREASVLHGEED